MADLDIGPVVTPPDVEFAVRDTLRDSMPWYLGQVDVDNGLPRASTTPPRSYVTRSENERWAEETPPALVVACPGFANEPQKHGPRGSYGAWFQVNVGVTVGGATEEGTRQLAGRHLAAVLLVLGQQPDMGGLAKDTDIVGATIDTIPPQRTLIGCEVVANVYVARVLDTRGLIPRDLPDPPDPIDQTPVPTGLRVRVTAPSE